MSSCYPFATVRVPLIPLSVTPEAGHYWKVVLEALPFWLEYRTNRFYGTGDGKHGLLLLFLLITTHLPSWSLSKQVQSKLGAYLVDKLNHENMTWEIWGWSEIEIQWNINTKIQQILLVIFILSSCSGHRTGIMAGVGKGCEAQKEKHIGQ